MFCLHLYTGPVGAMLTTLQEKSNEVAIEFRILCSKHTVNIILLTCFKQPVKRVEIDISVCVVLKVLSHSGDYSVNLSFFPWSFNLPSSELPSYWIVSRKALNECFAPFTINLLHQEELIPALICYYCSSGQEVQRISVINNLPDLLRDHHEDCMRRVVPKVRVSKKWLYTTVADLPPTLLKNPWATSPPSVIFIFHSFQFGHCQAFSHKMTVDLLLPKDIKLRYQF